MIAVLLADGFEEMEALVTVDMLRRAELDVKTVGVTGQTVTGSHGITVSADRLPNEVSKADVVVLPGGMPGTLNLKQSPFVRDLIDRTLNQKGMVAAICAAPSILGEMGLLSGKNATVFPGFEASLKGALLSDEPVVHDGQIVTAKGPGVTVDFATKLIELLCDVATAKSIKDGMQCVR